MALGNTERATSGQTGTGERRLRDLNLAAPDAGTNGVQVRMYNRAVEAANTALRLLDRLKVLDPGSPAGNVTALKGLIRSEFSELVGELALANGPRSERIEQIFSLLLDQLGELQEGIEDDDNLTSFRTLADCVASLFRSWNNIQQLFGTQTGIVRQQFQLVLDALEEFRFTMDAVFLGATERQTMMVRFALDTGDAGSVSLEELLGWVQDLAESEGPEAIEKSGGFALRNSIFPAATRLASLTGASLETRNLAHFPKLCSTPPLLRAMKNLQARLDELAWNC
jgi:hypothetical protein